MKINSEKKEAVHKKTSTKPVALKKKPKPEAMGNSYVDLYLLPLPKKNLEKYRANAMKFGKMVREYGALEYREFVADDLFPKGTLSFSKAAEPNDDEVVIAAVVDFLSRAHRNNVMKKIFKDPRMADMMKEEPLADMRKMYYGGFKTIVKIV